jgi:hypothetical protein
MKTKQLYLMLLALFTINAATQLQSQNLFENETTFQDLDVTSMSLNTIDLRTYEINTDDFELEYSIENAPQSITENDAETVVALYAYSMIAFGAGFGFTEFETLWCLHAEYYLRLALIGNAAVYGSLGLGHNSTNADNFTSNITDVFLKVLMFSVLAKQYQQVKLQYGILAKYGFGNYKYNDGYKTDITTLALGIVLGLHILITSQWSFMVQTNLLTYQELTNKFDGGETKSNSTFGLINKSNILAFSLVYTLANSKR